MEQFEKVELNEKAAFRRGIFKALCTVLIVALIALSAALILRTYVLSSFYVNGSSMQPTLDGGPRDDELKDGDVLYLNKLAKIRRGDIIVFTPQWISLPGDEWETLVKRVIAVAGDTVEIKNGAVYLNGAPLDEPYVMEPIDASVNVGAIRIPDGYVYCLGDNRNHSSDSRMFGPAPLSCVEGRCFLIKSSSGKLRKP